MIRAAPWQTPAAGVRTCSALLASLDVFAVNCPLQFFPANLYEVVGSSFRPPPATVINFDPATGETTPGKRRYEHPMFTFLYGHRCARLLEIKIQLCRLPRFDRRIIDGAFHGRSARRLGILKING